MPKHVYIDLDGTLTDPLEGIARCINHALQVLGAPRQPDDSLRQYIGPPLLETFSELVGDARAPRALELYRERFADVGWRENVPYEGVHEALELLNQDGHRCFVATSKPRVYAQRIIEHFGMSGYFAEVYGAELDGTRSDKTELLAHAQAQRSERREAAMIGDRRHDIIGAANNGLRAIGVTYGYGTRLELETAGAHAFAESPGQLPDLV